MRNESVLLLTCADGAGSALHAEIGARIACVELTRLVLADLADGLTLAETERDTAVSWYLRLRQTLEREAQRRQAPIAALATTLLLAVVGPRAAVFCQVGDGAIVTNGADGYRPVFWPQTGEYANSTNFITDTEVADTVAFARRLESVDELALMTDGLQMLGLTYADRGVHQPFFRPMFERLRQARAGEGLARGLRQFLDSPAVRERSDDDKTLLLATRMTDRAPPP